MHQRKRLLYSEEQAFHIDVEDRIIKLLTNLAKMGILCNARIRENDIELAHLPSNLFEEAVQVAEIRHIPLHAGRIVSDLLHRRSQFGVAAARNEDVGTLAHKPFCSSQSNTTIA